MSAYWEWMPLVKISGAQNPIVPHESFRYWLGPMKVDSPKSIILGS
jgi:hypothetical protein